INRPVAVQNLYDRTKGLSTLADEHSAWIVDEHTVEITHLAGIQSLEVLKVCVHAEKKMSTIRMALKIPITIATLIMLVSPSVRRSTHTSLHKIIYTLLTNNLFHLPLLDFTSERLCCVASDDAGMCSAEPSETNNSSYTSILPSCKTAGRDNGMETCVLGSNKTPLQMLAFREV
ncbi:hypothetical protein OSTOST_02114, partial [Ostertagia ostertagi]